MLAIGAVEGAATKVETTTTGACNRGEVEATAGAISSSEEGTAVARSAEGTKRRSSPSMMQSDS